MTAEERLEELRKGNNKRVKRYRKDKKGITIQIEKEIVEELEEKLKEDNLNKTEFFRKAIEKYLKK